ncbi:MAG: hypothetical protein HC872_06965 [Gammaproteobacteria bacterium]|nr:hypothetical protein [Gammaproteobacteria bacterium]
MYRYFILIWNAHDPQSGEYAGRLGQQLQARGPQWQRVVTGNSFAAYQAGERTGVSEWCAREGGSVHTFGTVFRRAGVSDPNGGVTNGASQSDARHTECPADAAAGFIRAHWGRYVALVTDATASRAAIVRDPSGMLPCYLVNRAGVLICFSDLEDCIGLEPLTFSIDWDYVAAAALNCALHTRATGLKEVSELLPGECAEVDGERVRRSLLWHPFDVAQTAVLEDTSEAVAELRSIAQHCVDAWSRLHPGILHCLSGGLDSSILLACLTRSRYRPVVTCLTYYAPGRDADERVFARLAAHRGGVALIERELVAAGVGLQRLHEVRRSPRPGYYLTPLQRQRQEAALAHWTGASAIFSGGGGDAVFYQGRADLALADRLRRFGGGPSRCAVAFAAARITGRSIGSLLLGAVRNAWLAPSGPYVDLKLQQQPSLLTAAAAASAEIDLRWRHPWLEDGSRVGPGKRWHALSLAPPANYYDAFDQPGDPERVYPLLSQPLVEVCLRIPTDLLISGGWDRAMARRAFASELPAEIAQRRAKGGIDHLGSRILLANLPFVREMLLGGLLVREGVLHRERLEQCLGRPSEADQTRHNQILHEYLSIEAWARRCAGLAQPTGR